MYSEMEILPANDNKQNEEKKTLRYVLDFVWIMVIGIFTCLWVFLGFKAFILSCGLLSLFMYITVTVTTLCNAFIGRDINPKADLFWRYLFSFLSAICLTIGIIL